MRISVIVPSRGRPNPLIGAITAMHQLYSGKHDVTYGIICDSDDHATIGVAQILQNKFPIAYRVQERGPSLGQMVNEMCDLMPADVYLSFADDVVCMTKNWDDIIATEWEKDKKAVWWWTPHSLDQPALYAIVSHEWKVAAGKVFTDYFPYWYDDLWLLSVWILATEGPMLTMPITLMDCPMATHRMRDLRFWHNFYIDMQPLRIKQAKMMAEKLGFPQSKLVGAAVGLPDLSISEALSARLCITPEGFDRDMEKIEANQGDKDPVTPAYLKAKERAQKMIDQVRFLRGAAPAMAQLEGMVLAAH